MSALGVRRAAGSVSRRQIFQLMRRLLRAQMLLRLFRIALSLIFLPLDNTILFVAVIYSYISSLFPPSGTRNRRQILQDVRFYPKTILVTGVDTPHGLGLTRRWYNEGHRVVGADITDAQVTSGESMSRALFAYYRIPKAGYVSGLLDIVQREKVDVWIPCSQYSSAVEDATAKGLIESRTACKCITLDAEFAAQWGRPESFMQYLQQNDLPIMESQLVQSRDSIHKILHRSPTKIYHLRKTAGDPRQDNPIVLPKRTLSLTYSEVSKLQISKDSPWLIQQHARLGESIAELLMISGAITAIAVRPANQESTWGNSPLNEGLTTTIHKLMERFASAGGPRATGHLSIRLMVDEELNTDSVRYAVYIAGCTQGPTAIAHLLQSTPTSALASGYLTALSPNGLTSKPSLDVLPGNTRTSITKTPMRWSGLCQMARGYDIRRGLPAFYPVAQRIDWVVDEAGNLLLFWRNWRFSLADPLPWWWHNHVFHPWREMSLMLDSKQR
ncbi:uncharacterized protein BJX67DRAFT_60697 [Aspergillus lucknowensis]|uniref:Uncharacterized protein n=1 Tax=Aspergillus lucknowensis TaxID=176173 RepID=A0ABR4LU89_9EURO